MQNSEKDSNEKHAKNKHSLSPIEDRKGKTYKFVDRKQGNNRNIISDSTKRMKINHSVNMKQQESKKNRTNSENRIEKTITAGNKILQSTQGADSVESATMNMAVTYAGIQAEKFIDGHNSENKTEQRIKRAAELQQINSELIKVNRAKAEFVKENKEKFPEKTYKTEIKEKQIASAKKELQEQKKDIKRENRKDSLEDAIHSGKEIAGSVKSANSVESATMNATTAVAGIEAEKMAQRIKRAKELQKLNSERVNLELAKAEFAEKSNDNNKENITENTEVSNADEKSEKSQNDEKVIGKETAESVNSEEFKELSKDQYKKEQAEKKFNDKKKEQKQESAEKNKLEKKSETIGNSNKSSLSQIYHTGKDIAGGLQSADSVSSATMNVTAVLAEIEAKKLVKNLADKKIDVKSIMERVKNNRNRYGIEKYDEVYDRSAKGQREKKEAEKIEKKENKKIKFEGSTGNSNKFKEEKKSYAKKQKANDIKTRRQGIFVKENKKLNGGVLNFGGVKGTAKSYLKKKGTALLLGGSAGLVVPIFLMVLIIIIIIMSFFSWLTPHKYKLSSGEFEANEEADVIESYCVMIQDFMTISQYSYMVSYGDYADEHAKYDWKPAQAWATWGDYYEIKVKPLIDAAVKEIQDTYNEAIANAAKNKNYDECGRLGQEMSKEIAAKTEELIEQGKIDYDEQIDNLNDMLGEPRESSPSQEREIVHFKAQGCSGKKETKLTRTGKDEIEDMGQYNGKQAGGTNSFNVGTLSFSGASLSPEEILPYIALANSLSLASDSKSEESETTSATETTAPITEEGISGTVSETEIVSTKKQEDKNPEITEEEINDFFERTKFVQLKVKFEKGCCNGCTRKLEGNWNSGWHWVYYCKGDEDMGGDKSMKHQILTGEISFLSEDELLEAVMSEYNAEEVGLSEKDCKDIVKEYKKYMKKEIGSSSRPITDKDMAVVYYNNYVYLDTATSSPWSPTSPLPSEEDEENTEETENNANETA